jgi:hypothetical protein
MFVWCTILFLLGITAFLDSMFNYGEIFRQINSVLFMLISLGLLVRTTIKARSRVIERQVERIGELETKVAELEEEYRNASVEQPSGPVPIV